MPQAARDHDGLVVAAHRHAAHLLLVLAEVARQVGPAELVVERGAAQRPSVMICSGLAMWPGLPPGRSRTSRPRAWTR